MSMTTGRRRSRCGFTRGASPRRLGDRKNRLLVLEQLEHRLVLSNFAPVIGPLDTYEVNENTAVTLEGTFTDEYASGGGVEVGLDPADLVSLGVFNPTSNVTIDTSPLTPTMTGGGIFDGIVVDGIAVFTFDSIVVDAGITITATGDRPLALLSQTDVTIAGVIDVSATYDTPGPGGGAGGTDLQEDGDPAAGAPVSGAGQGGTGWVSVSTCSGGGGGAYGGNGGIGSANNAGRDAGPGGTAYGNLETSLLAGSGGGASSGRQVSTFPEQAGHGGNGGGAIEIGATGNLTLSAGNEVLAAGSSGTAYYTAL